MSSDPTRHGRRRTRTRWQYKPNCAHLAARLRTGRPHSGTRTLTCYPTWPHGSRRRRQRSRYLLSNCPPRRRRVVVLACVSIAILALGVAATMIAATAFLLTTYL